MVAVTCVIADRLDAVKEKFITVTKIQKRAIMDKEFNARLGPNRAGSVAIVPHQAYERAEIRDDDIGYVEIIIDKRCRGSDPKIAMVVDEVIVQRLAYSKLPARRKIIAVTEIGVETSGVGTLRVKKTGRDLHLAGALGRCCDGRYIAEQPADQHGCCK